jgi:hypothetical protein
MTKQEIFKLQLDACMNPHVMWRESTTFYKKESLLELCKMESMWEWGDDIEHDASLSYWISSDEIYVDLAQEILDCCLMNVSKKATEEYDKINDTDYQELWAYVIKKLEKIIRHEAYDKEAFSYFLKIHKRVYKETNNLIIL